MTFVHPGIGEQIKPQVVFIHGPEVLTAEQLIDRLPELTKEQLVVLAQATISALEMVHVAGSINPFGMSLVTASFVYKQGEQDV